MEARLDENSVTEPDQTHSGPEIDPGPGTERPKRQKTGGRKPGARNKRSVMHDGLAEICRNLTAGNLKWRQNLKALCESPEIFNKPHLVAVLLSHGYGKPAIKAPEQLQKSPLLFVVQSMPMVDPLADKVKALAARRAERALLAPDAYVPPDPTDESALVIVEPEPWTLAGARLMGPAPR